MRERFELVDIFTGRVAARAHSVREAWEKEQTLMKQRTGQTGYFVGPSDFLLRILLAAIVYGAVLCAPARAANPFATAWHFVTGYQEPAGVSPDGCTILDRNFAGPPRVDKKEWNVACVLEAPVTAAQLANVKDPTAFLNARVGRLTKTPAVEINSSTGKIWPLNGAYLVSEARAQTLSKLLASWGCTMAPEEVTTISPFQTIDWRGEERRYWQMGRINLGLVEVALASSTVETVQRRIRAEITECRVE